jgi:Ca-activated chloride channel family protein
MNEKPKRTKRNWLLTSLLLLGFVAVITILILIVMGPIVGNTFSDVISGLDGGTGYSAPLNASSSLQMSGDTALRPTSAPLENEEPQEMSFEDYGVNPFVESSQDNLSTFAMDVDTASYTLVRSYLLDSHLLPPNDAVRPEEFINYFPTNYTPPSDGSAFAIQMDAAPSPFSAEGQILLRVGIQGRIVAPADRQAALLIFVIDISGSMEGPLRLAFAKQSLEILTAQLRADDRVGIVVYSTEARVVLSPTSASERERILAAIHSLHTEGSTYAEAGLRLGYEMALANTQADQITRVILLSDGVANVGETGPDAILQTIRQGVDGGVTLSTIGFGMGGYNDTLMEQLANDGNGNYFYIDNLREATRIFSYSLTSTLQVIGYDARIQIEFAPEVVASYRLIGYENRAIADEDFRNDSIDAGEVGAGHSITALYELVLVDAVQSGTIATASLRYEEADSRQVQEISQSFALEAIRPNFEDSPADFRFIAALAEFSEILRGSPYGDSGYSEILTTIEPLAQSDPAASEVLSLLYEASTLQGQ